MDVGPGVGHGLAANPGPNPHPALARSLARTANPWPLTRTLTLALTMVIAPGVVWIIPGMGACMMAAPERLPPSSAGLSRSPLAGAARQPSL